MSITGSEIIRFGLRGGAVHFTLCFIGAMGLNIELDSVVDCSSFRKASHH